LETSVPLTAFIFANGDRHDGPLVRQLLAEWPSAWIIAADGGARHAEVFGIPVQTIIGDMDSLTPEELAAFESQGAQLRRYPPEKNETDLELALLLAAERGVLRIRVFAALGDRLDQTLGNIYLFALPALRGIDTRMIAGKQEAWLIYPGENIIHGSPGDTVSLIPISGPVNGVRTAQLYYPLKRERLEFGPARGMSNIMQTETARVWLDDGILLVVHTLGRA
jgi:thiamine pyrophosphokinase